MPAPQLLPANRPTVVLADNDAALRDALRFALELEGFQVAAFGSGEALLSSALPLSGACLVIDARLPDLGGLAAVGRLRRRDAALPAILIATNPGPALRKAAELANVTIVEKPLLGDTLANAIHQALASGAHVG